MLSFLKSLLGKSHQSPLYLFNTLTRKKELFKSIQMGKVSFYHCGPTVYWTQHIGNLRANVLSDLIRRTFIYNNYQVKLARNYTDVGHLVSDGDTGEDKMEKGVKRESKTPAEIADKYIKIFEADTKDLNVLEPDYKPRATEYISEMQAMVKVLLEKGFAYTTDLAVYFDVSKVSDYTKLSGQNLAENRAGAGNGEADDPKKKNQADFAIWIFRAGEHQNAIQYWPSPFASGLALDGNGFPGWHIECSAMSKKLLGDTIDIHMGGIEHIPVHHTNEIAQSESANGVPLANYWLHNEWLMVNNGKMAKSEGTAYSLAEVKEKGFNPLALRYFFLQAHYRSKQNFTWEALEAASTGYNRLLGSISTLGNNIGKVNYEFKLKFENAIYDDFNSPQALAVIFDLLKSNISETDKLATILDFDKVLGLDFQNAIQGSSAKIEIPENVQKLIDARKIARANKDWPKADQLRAEIIALGYEVKDKE